MQATEGVNFENPSDIFAKLFAAIPHVIATAKKNISSEWFHISLLFRAN